MAISALSVITHLCKMASLVRLGNNSYELCYVSMILRYRQLSQWHTIASSKSRRRVVLHDEFREHCTTDTFTIIQCNLKGPRAMDGYSNIQQKLVKQWVLSKLDLAMLVQEGLCQCHCMQILSHPSRGPK